MKTILVLSLCIITQLLHAQKTGDPRKFASTILPADLKKHLLVIASDSLEGRETASEGQRRAAAYITHTFRQLGLLPGWQGGYEQQFPVYQDSLIGSALTINGRSLTIGADYTVSETSAGGISFNASEVVFAGFGRSDSSRNDFKDLNIRGKIVVVVPGVSDEKRRNRNRRQVVADFEALQETAARYGAAALLVADRKFPRDVPPANGYMYANRQNNRWLPDLFIISDSVTRLLTGKDITSLQQMAQKPGLAAAVFAAEINMQLQKTTKRMESSNVIGVLEGSDKKAEALIITAHYDHLGLEGGRIHYGADDDGSGTVAVLELAEAFSRAAASGSRPRRTVIFMAVSGEEKGLWGSAYYAQNPSFDMKNITANLNIDMIGRVESGRKADSMNYVYVVGDDKLSSDLRPINEGMNKKYSNLNLDYKFNDPADPMRIYYRSDHYNFAKNGVPVIFYFNGLHDDYHRPSDTEDKINYELLSKRARMIFYTAWEMANRDELIKRDLPPVNQLR